MIGGCTVGATLVVVSFWYVYPKRERLSLIVWDYVFNQ
jgi:hypothetical protein